MAAIIAKGAPTPPPEPERHTMPIMFLGGPLDHTVRQVPHALGRPTGDEIRMFERSYEVRGKQIAGTPDIPECWKTYKLHQGRAGRATWWLYVLVGYDPPRRHFVDTMPVSAVSKL